MKRTQVIFWFMNTISVLMMVALAISLKFAFEEGYARTSTNKGEAFCAK
ncbi:hypothetical protein [Bdellovibrio sp. BCCA]